MHITVLLRDCNYLYFKKYEATKLWKQKKTVHLVEEPTSYEVSRVTQLTTQKHISFKENQIRNGRWNSSDC